MTIVFPDKQFVTHTGRVRQGYYLDETLRVNLDLLKQSVLSGWDGIGVITGMEGSGKSTLVQAIAHYCDPTIDIDRIVFSGEDLMKAIDNAKKHQAIIFDEAILDMSSQDFAATLQQILIKKFTLIRSRNLYIFLVIPSFFMLRKYFAMFRTRFLINCYTPDGIKRGFFSFYSYARKKKLYLHGMKEWNMAAILPNFRARFTNTAGFFVSPEAYEAKKQEAVKRLTEEGHSPMDKIKQEFEDYKLKVKLDVEKYKEKTKVKIEKVQAKLMQKAKIDKQKADMELKQIRAESVELIKSKEKERIRVLERSFMKLLNGFYTLEKKRFETLNPSSTFEYQMFHDMLKNESYIDIDMHEFKRCIENGAECVKVDAYKNKKRW